MHLCGLVFYIFYISLCELLYHSMLLACYFAPIGLQSIAIIVSVSIFVCLFICLSTRISQKPHVRIPPNFLYILPAAIAFSSSDSTAIHYSFPVLWMTSCFQARIEDDTYVLSSSPCGGTSQTSENVIWLSSPGGGIGAESAICDCILFILYCTSDFHFVS